MLMTWILCTVFRAKQKIIQKHFDEKKIDLERFGLHGGSVYWFGKIREYKI